jgi:hypothetical protein
MAGKIEDCAIIGNTRTVALIDRSGSVYQRLERPLSRALIPLSPLICMTVS